MRPNGQLLEAQGQCFQEAAARHGRRLNLGQLGSPAKCAHRLYSSGAATTAVAGAASGVDAAMQAENARSSTSPTAPSRRARVGMHLVRPRVKFELAASSWGKQGWFQEYLEQ